MALLKNFVRPTDDRMIAGVCAGVARQLGVEAQLVRAVLVVAVLVGGLGLWVYPLAWLVMPAEGSERAGIDVLVERAKDLQAQQKSRGTDGPTEVFNPYAEPRR